MGCRRPRDNHGGVAARGQTCFLASSVTPLPPSGLRFIQNMGTVECTSLNQRQWLSWLTESITCIQLPPKWEGMFKVRLNSRRDWTLLSLSKWFHVEPLGHKALRETPVFHKSSVSHWREPAGLSHSVAESDHPVGKDNFKMACKDDRICTKSLLFIYAKICVDVKCHLHHALFMAWLFL